MLSSQNHESISKFGVFECFDKTEGGSVPSLVETIVLFCQPNHLQRK